MLQPDNAGKMKALQDMILGRVELFEGEHGNVTVWSEWSLFEDVLRFLGEHMGLDKFTRTHSYFYGKSSYLDILNEIENPKVKIKKDAMPIYEEIVDFGIRRHELQVETVMGPTGSMVSYPEYALGVPDFMEDFDLSEGESKGHVRIAYNATKVCDLAPEDFYWHGVAAAAFYESVRCFKPASLMYGRWGRSGRARKFGDENATGVFFDMPQNQPIEYYAGIFGSGELIRRGYMVGSLIVSICFPDRYPDHAQFPESANCLNDMFAIVGIESGRSDRSALTKTDVGFNKQDYFLNQTTTTFDSACPQNQAPQYFKNHLIELGELDPNE